MSVNIPIDDELLRKAMELSNTTDSAALIRKIIEKYVNRREAENRLIALGATMPELEMPPRQRIFEKP